MDAREMKGRTVETDLLEEERGSGEEELGSGAGWLEW